MILAMLHADGDFSWTAWPIHWSTLIGSVVLLGAYFAGIGPLRRKYRWAGGLSSPKRSGADAARPSLPATEDRVELWQPICFSTGILILFGVLNGPIHELSDFYLFSAHMVQHLLLTLVMAPLMLVGVPDWLWRAIVRNTVGFGVARMITSPLIAFGIYNVVFAGWHFPMLYNWALENHTVHIVQHVMFIAAAMFMWWPVVDPLPELSRLITPLRMVYLFAISVPMSVVSALITLSDSVLYPWYSDAKRVFALNAIED